MGSPIASMLMGQAAPAGDALSGLSPEAQAALRALNGQGGVPPPQAQTMPAVGPTPPPQTQPTQPQPGYLDMLVKAFSSLMPNNRDLMPQTQATLKPPTPEELAARNQRISGQQ